VAKGDGVSGRSMWSGTLWKLGPIICNGLGWGCSICSSSPRAAYQMPCRKLILLLSLYMPGAVISCHKISSLRRTRFVLDLALARFAALMQISQAKSFYCRSDPSLSFVSVSRDVSGDDFYSIH
jgi:hypothetical protein